MTSGFELDVNHGPTAMRMTIEAEVRDRMLPDDFVKIREVRALLRSVWIDNLHGLTLVRNESVP